MTYNCDRQTHCFLRKYWRRKKINFRTVSEKFGKKITQKCILQTKQRIRILIHVYTHVYQFCRISSFCRMNEWVNDLLYYLFVCLLLNCDDNYIIEVRYGAMSTNFVIFVTSIHILLVWLLLTLKQDTIAASTN